MRNKSNKLGIMLSLLVMASAPALANGKPTPSSASPQIGEPAKGTGRVVIYRIARHADGYFSSCKVRQYGANQTVALPNIRGNRYLVTDVAPGTYDFSVKVETTDHVRLEIEEGETYYLQCSMTAGILSPRPDLRPSTQEEFQATPKLQPN